MEPVPTSNLHNPVNRFKTHGIAPPLPPKSLRREWRLLRESRSASNQEDATTPRQDNDELERTPIRTRRSPTTRSESNQYIDKNGELTLCEIQGNLVTMRLPTDSEAIGAYQSAGGVIYPHILIGEADLQSMQFEAFRELDQNKSWLARYAHPYAWLRALSDIAEGSAEASETRTRSFAEHMWALGRHLLGETLQLTRLWSPPPRLALPSSLQATRAATVRLLRWHPYTHCFALALADDSIRFYDMNTESFSELALRHEYQRDIEQMEWSPCASNLLAVACRGGVCLWRIMSDKQTSSGELYERPDVSSRSDYAATRTATHRRAASPSTAFHTAWMNYLSEAGHAPVTSLAWSPDGTMLASGSPCDAAMCVWDAATLQCDVLHPPASAGLGLGGALRRALGRRNGVCMLRWSPNGYYVLCANLDATFRIWETTTWTCERWSNLSAHVQAACWSPDSCALVLAAADDAVLHAFRFDFEPPRIAARYQRADAIGRYEATLSDGDTQRCGGFVRELAWDPSGSRLAVAFVRDERDAGEGCELIALLETQLQPVLDLVPIGFVRGAAVAQQPHSLTFRPQYAKGALLTTCWANGKVSFYPLFFTTTGLETGNASTRGTRRVAVKAGIADRRSMQTSYTTGTAYSIRTRAPTTRAGAARHALRVSEFHARRSGEWR